MSFSTGFFDWLFGERVEISLPDGRRQRVTKRWFEEMQRRQLVQPSNLRDQKVQVHLLNPACRVLPSALPLPVGIDPDIYAVAEWTVGREVSPDLASEWLDLDTHELYAIRMLSLRDGRSAKPAFVYGDPQFVTRAEWEKQAAHHGVVRQPKAADEVVGGDRPKAGGQERQSENRWTGGEVHLVFPPLPPYMRRQSGALFQRFAFSKEVGEEVALFLLDDPEFARQLGQLKPFHLAARCGMVHTSAGAIAFILWSVSSQEGHVVDYEHPLNPFNPETLQMLRAAGCQKSLKVVILDSFSGKSEGFLEFENNFRFDRFATGLATAIAGKPAADFAATQAALRAEFTLEELKKA